MKLSLAIKDPAAGVLLSQAIGDALGVPYEFAARISPGEARMKGGGLGPYAPGEWSDDTQMALCIAQVAATQPDLTNPDALDAIAQAFLDWRLHGATDDCGDSPRIPRRRQADLSADDWPRRGRCRHRPGRQRGPDEDLGRQPVRLGLRRAKWRACLDRAETEPPSSFNPNGYTVSALQAPWASI